MQNLFYLTDEQRAIRDLARDIARERIAPRAAHVDETSEYPQEQLAALAKQGLMGLRLDLDHLPRAEPRRLSHSLRGHRGAEAPLPPAHRRGRDHRRIFTLRV